jgi:hypothetical protein
MKRPAPKKRPAEVHVIPNGSGAVFVKTKAQLEDRAERVAQDLLNVSRVRAFKMLDQGKLRGTLAESALTPLRDLLAD